jgi:hypothetical protein
MALTNVPFSNMVITHEAPFLEKVPFPQIIVDGARNKKHRQLYHLTLNENRQKEAGFLQGIGFVCLKG